VCFCSGEGELLRGSGASFQPETEIAAYFSREMTLGTEIIKFPLIPATFPAFMEINYVHHTHIHTVAFFHTSTQTTHTHTRVVIAAITLDWLHDHNTKRLVSVILITHVTYSLISGVYQA